MVVFAACVALARHVAVAAEMVSSTAPTDYMTRMCMRMWLLRCLIMELGGMQESLRTIAFVARREGVGALT